MSHSLLLCVCVSLGRSFSFLCAVAPVLSFRHCLRSGFCGGDLALKHEPFPFPLPMIHLVSGCVLLLILALAKYHTKNYSSPVFRSRSARCSSVLARVYVCLHIENSQFSIKVGCVRAFLMKITVVEHFAPLLFFFAVCSVRSFSLAPSTLHVFEHFCVRSFISSVEMVMWRGAGYAHCVHGKSSKTNDQNVYNHS